MTPTDADWLARHADACKKLDAGFKAAIPALRALAQAWRGNPQTSTRRHQ